MAKLANVEERRTTNIRNVVAEGKIGVKFNSEVKCMLAWNEGVATKGNRRLDDFRTLLMGAIEKIFSFVRVYRKTIYGEPGVYSIKGRRQTSKSF